MFLIHTLSLTKLDSAVSFGSIKQFFLQTEVDKFKRSAYGRNSKLFLMQYYYYEL